jgi:hypothetical protein
MGSIESRSGVSPDGSDGHGPRRDRRYRCRSCCVPATSVGFSAALGRRNPRGHAESKLITSRPTLLFRAPLSRWRIRNVRQAPARVDLLVGGALGWRGAIGHHNLPSAFQSGFRCLARGRLRGLDWVARLLARHRIHSFRFILAAAPRSGQSSSAVWPGTRAAIADGHSWLLSRSCRAGSHASVCTIDRRKFSGRRTDRISLSAPAKREAAS